MPTYVQSDSIRRLFSQGQPLFFGKGDIILGNEPEPGGVYYISTGYVKTYSISDDGDEYLHIIYGHGELFPLEWAYLGLEPESWFYEAISDCSVWRISREWFVKTIKSDLSLSYNLSLQLAQQSSLLEDRLDNLEYKKASERIIYRLLFLAGRFGTKDGNQVTLDFPLTHDVFASSVNLTRESVSREVELLESQNLITHKGRVLIINDVQTLSHHLSRPGNFDHWFM